MGCRDISAPFQARVRSSFEKLPHDLFMAFGRRSLQCIAIIATGEIDLRVIADQQLRELCASVYCSDLQCTAVIAIRMVDLGPSI